MPQGSDPFDLAEETVTPQVESPTVSLNRSADATDLAISLKNIAANPVLTQDVRSGKASRPTADSNNRGSGGTNRGTGLQGASLLVTGTIETREQ